LEVVRPGLLTTVQDLGRWGHQAIGVPVAGAMDTHSLRLANLLVGNPPGAAALEITLRGPVLRAASPLTLAVTGAEFELRVDEVRVPHGLAVAVAAGAQISFGARAPGAGARAYLAVAGGIATRPVLGSRSTHLVSRMGGVDGRALAAGDVLPVGTAPAPTRRRTPAARAGAIAPGPQPLRVLLGPQDDWFTAGALDALLSDAFTVSARSDRMGYRLEGPRLDARRRGELLSEPVPFGALQVPASGDPILLMADRQTAGGYPKIATVIAADLPVAGQLAPGDVVRFAACSRIEARAALIARERDLLRAWPEDAPS
jgi:antagonist of KipI